MKIVQTAAIGVCLFTSIAVQAQTGSGAATKSDKKLKEYKSKEWRQGVVEVKNNGQNGTDDKHVLQMPKKTTVPPVPAPQPLRAAKARTVRKGTL